MTKTIGLLVIAVLVIGGAWYFSQNNDSSSDAMETEEKMMEENTDNAMMEEKSDSDSMMEGEAMMKSGTYGEYSGEKLALAGEGDLVLFFHANWCPTCRALDAALSESPIPEGVHILKVDYDSNTALRQQYGVTTQHTLVQVNVQGEMIQKFQGVFSIEDIVGKL